VRNRDLLKKVAQQRSKSRCKPVVETGSGEVWLVAAEYAR
jgi:hypothetical protein